MNQKSVQTVRRAADVGLPDYFDMQAAIRHTKHVGGWKSTQEIAEMCQLGEGQELVYVGSGSGVAAIQIAQTYGCKVMGVDLLETMVVAAEQWAEERGATNMVEFQVGDAPAGNGGPDKAPLVPAQVGHLLAFGGIHPKSL